MFQLLTFRPNWRTAVLFTCLALLSTVSGFSFSSTDVEEIPGDAAPVYITDINGGKWDVGHAIHFYGFDLKGFSSGKGPYTRPPIVDPEMLSPGEPGYPPDGATVRVVATFIGNEGRAYPLNIIARNEVVNDRVAGTPVTVAY